MHKIIGGTAIVFALTACGVDYSNTSGPQTHVYCLEEQERDGFDYMVVTDMSVCDKNIDDVELFETDSILKNGDVAYVEKDGSHSKAKVKLKSEVKHPAQSPNYVPQTGKVCNVAYKPKPKPPTATNKATSPATVKAPTPAPTTPKTTIVVPTPNTKTGC